MRIAESRIETIQYVMPEHANPLGNLFGGKMMHWMTTAGTLAASRLARGPVVLGSMNDIDFLSPVHVAELACLCAQVEWTGTSSMEVSVRVESENPSTSERRFTTRSNLAFVAIDRDGRPRPLPTTVEPHGSDEETIHDTARRRKEQRISRMAGRRERLARDQRSWTQSDTSPRVSSCRIVFPENAIHSGIMFAGDLMMDIDEIGGILAHRHSRSVVVTAAIDAMDFFHPIRVGDILTFHAALNWVGRTSMEIGVRVESEDLHAEGRHHNCSAYLTFVALDGTGRPRPVAPYTPATEEERRRRDDAEKRRGMRLRRARG
jgi:acyl-CoA hydrolase